MTFNEFYVEVVEQAQRLGYSITQIRMFKGDIEDCYYSDKSVEDTVNEIF